MEVIQGPENGAASGSDRGESEDPDKGSIESSATGRNLWNSASKKVRLASILGAFRTLRDMCDHCFIPWSSLKPEAVLGQGAFAHVELCSYDAPWGVMKVAVKRLKPNIFECKKDKENFITEAHLCKKLSSDYIVRTIGMGFDEQDVEESSKDVQGEGADSQNWYIVQEWMNRGSLKALVLQQNDKPRGQVYTMPDALKWLIHVSKGLHYLHTSNPRVIHRDVKLDNIMLTETKEGEVRAKIGDFGLSVLVPPVKGLLRSKSSIRRKGIGSSITELERTCDGNDMYNLDPVTGSLLYMAPEVMGGTPYNEKADVFSFAIVTYEIFRQAPMVSFITHIGSSRDVEIHALKVMSGFRPDIPESWPDCLKSLVQDCWAQEPTKRPTMKNISIRLEEMRDSDYWNNPQLVLEPVVTDNETVSKEFTTDLDDTIPPEIVGGMVKPETPGSVVPLDDTDAQVSGTCCFSKIRSLMPPLWCLGK